MTMSKISVNIDGAVKQNAQKTLGEIGLDMTTAIDLFLRTVVREGQIPFSLQSERAYRASMHDAYIRSELAMARAEAADPNTVWVSQDEMKERLKQQREGRVHA